MKCDCVCKVPLSPGDETFGEGRWGGGRVDEV